MDANSIARPTRSARDAHASEKERARQCDLFDPSNRGERERQFRASRSSLCASLAALFQARQGEWINGLALAGVGGLYAWRTRISDLRRAPWFMNIQNRQRREDGYVISEYRLVVDEEE